MASFKQRIELGFESLAGFIYKFRWGLIVLMVVLAVTSASQLKKLTIDMSDEGFLHPEDPILTAYLDFRDQFGRDDLIVLAIKSNEIFSEKFLTKLSKLHRALENKLDHVNEITSMVNARNTYGTGDAIIVEDLLEKWPENKEDFTRLRQRVLGNPLYVDRLISADGTFTTLLIQLNTYQGGGEEDDFLAGFDDFSAGDEKKEDEKSFLTEKDKTKAVIAAHKVAASFQSPDFQIHIAGSPVITAMVKKTMSADMRLFIRLAILTIGICLFFMFRRISAAILPLLVVILSLISTLAVMAKFGVSIKMPTMILPSFILAVGVGDSVHILSIFFQRFNRDGNKRDAIVHALGHSGLAIVMTSLTTAGGLASFFTAKIDPIADLGIFSAFGVMLALTYSIIFLPALIAIIPLKPKANVVTKISSDTLMTRIMNWFTDFSTNNAKAIIGVSFVVLIVAGMGIAKLRFSHDMLSWLPEKMPVRQATQIIDKKLKGSVTLELILDTGKENGLYEPQVLNNIDRFARELEHDTELTVDVGKVMAVTDILKEIHQALNENRADFYAIPQNRKLIPQEFLLFENSGSDDLEDVIDSRFQLARITVKVPWQDAMYYVPFIEEIETRAGQIFGSDMKITTTGVMALFGRIIYASIYSAVTSYIIAAAVITLLMIFLLGNIRLGLISMIPNLMPIIITIGAMGWLNISLNMFTMLIGSIAIGIAVDDTIHFVYNFRRYFSQSGDPVEAIRNTLQTAGQAMLTTTIVLSIGFFIFMFASMQNFFYFGLLTGTALILALASDFLLAPALMTLTAGSVSGKSALMRR